MNTTIRGFSKLSKNEKINWLIQQHFNGNAHARKTLETYWNTDRKLQQLHDDFIENTLTNYYMPLGVAPNFLINGKHYTLPMAIEESSVVAAAAKAAKYWGKRGGFQAVVVNDEKIGQIHFIYRGDAKKLAQFTSDIKEQLLADVSSITTNMERRGGGIQSIDLRDQCKKIPHYFQLHIRFRTVDSMGANFINSCLEEIAKRFEHYLHYSPLFASTEKSIEVVMSILSNYVPDCTVKASVQCCINDLEEEEGLSKKAFAEKFVRAVRIAEEEPYRAVTHNKGIMNGVDALVIATGNDFRAVEAGVHAYAARDGKYKSLSTAFIDGDQFHFSLEIPLAIGTVGGLTNLHPLVKWSLELLGKPTAKELMQIMAVAGLAQNFAALRSLVTSGIQKGHMKMHLLNILNQLHATPSQKEKALIYFKTVPVSHSAVAQFLDEHPE